jgi:hypothetical protein
MELNLGIVRLMLSDTQALALFWAVAVAAAFNLAYLLFIWDRQRSNVTRARMVMTVLLGSLVVIGTYADALAAKPFAMKDCLLLALVGAHGWMAEAMVRQFMEGAAKVKLGGGGGGRTA